MMDNRFHKYTALGNDMIVIDPRHVDFELTPPAIKTVCDRHFGIGADGICYGPLNDSQPFEMRFYNPDGSESGKSGNGLRIFARYLCDAGYVTENCFRISIDNQICDVSVLDDSFQLLRISMGKATFQSDLIPVVGEVRQVINESINIDDTDYYFTAVQVGNPHCVIFTDELSVDLVKSVGAKIELHPMFPQRINVQWVRVIDEHTIRIEIWERGAGYTLASGTSSCAAASAAIINGFCRSPLTVQMARGKMKVDIDEDWNLDLTGSVQSIATGQFSQDLLRLLT